MSALVKCFDEFESIVFAGCRRNSELTIFDPPVILNTMMKQIPGSFPAADPALTEPPGLGVVSQLALRRLVSQRPKS